MVAFVFEWSMKCVCCCFSRLPNLTEFFSLAWKVVYVVCAFVCLISIVRVSSVNILKVKNIIEESIKSKLRENFSVKPQTVFGVLF